MKTRHQKFIIFVAVLMAVLFLACKASANSSKCTAQLNMYAVSLRLLDKQMVGSDAQSLRMQLIIKNRLINEMRSVSYCK